MGELNSCFDHKRIKETKDNIEGIYDNAVFSCFNQNLENLIASLPYYDENHDVISKNIETLEMFEFVIVNRDLKKYNEIKQNIQELNNIIEI